MRKLITLSILLFLISPFTRAQSGIDLYGSVLDARTKTPLFGATVHIEKSNLGAVVDQKGNFILRNVPVGTISVTARYLGYIPLTKTNIVIKSKGNDELFFELLEERGR